MKGITLSLSLFFPFILFSQTKFSPNQIQVTAGRSTHGTRDMRGIIFITEYTNYFKKSLFWTIALGGTIHDGSRPLFFNDAYGNAIDGSIRYTTAGVQATSHLGYSFIKTSRHELGIKVGALLRYQSSSYYDRVSISYPLATGLPIPVITFDNTTPQRTYAFGGSAQILYNYSINKAISLGIQAGFQTDTNGDTITQAAFTIGKRF